jgi:hypothetical protein
MFEWIYFALICYSIGVITGFIGVIAIFSYAMKKMRSQILPPKKIG